MKKASYKKLLKLLIDRDMDRKTLALEANVAPSTLTKITRGENVSMEILVKICNTLDCDLHDIVELIPDNKAEVKSND